MSIESELRRLVDEEVLWCVEPFPGDEAVRTVLVASDLDDLFANMTAMKRVGRLYANLQNIVTGGDVELSFEPFKHRNATFGLLDPEHEGTWEYRDRDPEPGLRVFGRFADIDTFVAIDWAPRSRPLDGFDKQPLGAADSQEYLFAQIAVQQFWNRHLAAIRPILGAKCSDYFSSGCSVSGVTW